MSSTRCDIAIVGGGAAGCAAAVSLAGSGLSVTMVAPPDDRGDRFGESLSPAANALLSELGLAQSFAAGPHRPANVSYAAWGSDLLAERNAIVHLDGPGHVLDRIAFDRMLYDAAERSGATMCHGIVEGITRDSAGWTLRTATGAAIDARFVLDCSGRIAVIARTVAHRHRYDRLVAAGAFLNARGSDVEPTPATLIEAVPGGWWYASLLPDQRLALALFGDSDTLPRGLTRDASVWRTCLAATTFVKRWLESADFDGEVVPRLATAATTWLEPVAGEGWAAAGDAAAAFDPLSSHGLTTALWSGRRAALAAVSALRGNSTLLTLYATAIRDAVQSFAVQRQAVYASEGRWMSLPFWQRRQREPVPS